MKPVSLAISSDINIIIGTVETIDKGVSLKLIKILVVINCTGTIDLGVSSLFDVRIVIFSLILNIYHVLVYMYHDMSALSAS